MAKRKATQRKATKQDQKLDRLDRKRLSALHGLEGAIKRRMQRRSKRK